MKTSGLHPDVLNSFGLAQENIIQLDERTYNVHKWEWDYSLAHQFQRLCLQLIDDKPNLRFLITCNHPRVLTHGRGLQKPRKGEVLELQEFSPSAYGELPFPLFQIERGGGLTFHHPGQFIFYPITRLNPKTLSLSKMVDDIFEVSSSVLTEWGMDSLSHKEKLLGLWHRKNKVASMGMAIEKLTTFHGMALNLFVDEVMMNALTRFNPCGLSSETYIAANEIIDLDRDALDHFRDLFMQRILHAWK